MNTYLTLDTTCTFPSRVTPLTVTAGQAAGMHWPAEVVLDARLRRFADGTQALGMYSIPANLDVLLVKQPPARVPQPSQERSP